MHELSILVLISVARSVATQDTFCQGKADGLHKKADDCSSYYSCNGGYTWVYQCPKGHLYHAKAKLCDLEINVDCSLQADTTEFCAGMPDGLYEYPYDCSMMYECAHSLTHVVQCHAGTYYNPLIMSCDWISNVKCGSRPVPGSKTITTNSSPPIVKDTFCDGKPDGVYKKTDDCGSFYECMSGHSMVIPCGPGMLFDARIKTCEKDTVVDCSYTDFCTGIPDGLYEYPDDCSMMYECSHFTTHVAQCPPGHYYNPLVFSCDWISNVKCGSRPEPDTFCDGKPDGVYKKTDDCGSFYECMSGHTMVIPCGPGMLFDARIKTCEKDTAVDCSYTDFCAGMPDGLYEYPDDCSMMYECAHSTTHVIQCPPGHYYNPLVFSCDWISNVKCGSRPEPVISTTTTTASPPPVKDAFCYGKPDGVYKKTDDCGSFYECMSGHSMVIPCGPGMLFDARIKTCEKDTVVDCSYTDFCAGMPDGLYEYPDDCSMMYECAHSTTHVTQCPPGHYYNPLVFSCDWISNVKCGSRPEPVSSTTTTTARLPTVKDTFCQGKADGLHKKADDCSSYYSCNGGYTWVYQCPKDHLYHAKAKLCDLEINVDCSLQADTTEFCARMPDGLYEYPDDCSMMYECAHSLTHVVQCHAGTYYNPLIMSCDWISNVKCGSRPVPGTNIVTTTSSPPIVKDTFCDGKPDGVYKKTDDCGSFYECMSGHSMVIPCGPGMLFDARIKTCEKDTAVDCSYTDFCAGMPDGLYEYPDDCSMMYECAHSTTHVIQCPPRHYYNPLVFSCDWISNVKCGSRPEPVISTTSTTASPPPVKDTFCDGKPDGVYKKTDDCGSFYECMSGHSMVIPCGPGMLFDARIKTCEKDTAVDCSYTDFCAGMPDGLYEYPDDCSMMYECAHSTTHVTQCPPGHYYNPLVFSCDWIGNVKCGSRPEPVISTTTTTASPPPVKDTFCDGKPDGVYKKTDDCGSFYECMPGHTMVIPCGPGMLFDARIKTCEKDTAVDCSYTDFCAGMPDGLYEYPDDCSMMYECTHSTTHVTQCPPGHYYNPLVFSCDWISNVKCGSRPEPVISTTTTTASPPPVKDTFCDGKPDGVYKKTDDCGSFYECMSGHTMVIPCGPGMLFDARIKTCEKDTAVDCSYTDFCAGMPDGLYEYPDDCSMMYECTHSTTHVTQCPPGHYYNPLVFNCDWISNVKCGSRPEPVISTTTTTASPPPVKDTFCYGKPDGVYKKTDDCGSFYECMSGHSMVIPCGPGMLFDARIKTCEKDTVVDCSFVDFCAGMPDGLYEYPHDCSMMYECVSSVTYMAACPSGLYYSPVISNCDWSFNVNCGARPVPGTTKATSTASTPSVNGNFCNGKPDGVYKNVDDCGSFYECVSGNTLLIPCGPGMLFDASKMICEMGTNVDCSYVGLPLDTTSTAALLSTNGPILPPVPVSDRLRVCYYSNWSQYRSGTAAFTPDDIDPFLCTHLIYSFAKLDSSFQLAQYEYNDEQLYASFNKLKSTNPNLKTLLALGGASAKSAHFSDLVSAATRRENFAVSAIDYLRRYGFDGLDMDWEYPTQHGGRSSDKANFVLLLKDLRAAFDKEGSSSGQPTLLLTAAVAAGKYFIDLAYDIPAMEKPLDFINLMAYDFHGSWESQVGHNSPLGAGSRDSDPTLNVEWAANYWHKQGVAKEKLVIGLATYGRSFTLSNSANHNIGDAVTGAGNPGPYTGEAGFLAYYEICAILDKSSGDQYWEPDSRVPYVVSGNQWIGYEDVKSFTTKLNWIRDEGFGGAMVWNIDLDDFRGDCSSSTRPYPLMSLMADVLVDKSNTPSTGTTKATSTISTPTANGNFCDGKPDGVYKNVDDCGSFYECVSGNTLLMPCGPGMLFDASKMICDMETNVDCSYGGLPLDTTTTAVLLSTNGPILPPVPVSDRLRVCYYSNWSQYRSGTAAFTPDDIDPFLCTHLIYSFAKLDSSFQLAQYEYNDEQLYASFNKLKSINPNLKTLLALGGASAKSAHFSDLVSAATRRENFAVSAIDYLRRYDFDGLDMDWEYPTQHGGRSSDKANFVLLLKDLRAAFDKEGSSSGQPTLLLTAAVAAGKYFIDLAYDIPAMEKPLDFINLMAYDFHGSWESQVGHNSPLGAGSRDSDPTLNVEWAANYWHKQGVAKEKLVIGLATYGRSFTLSNSANHNIGDAVTGAGNPGPYTGEAGFLAYYEICAILDKSSGDQYWEPDSRVPYVVSGNQWIGYEDVKSFTTKLNWIRDEGFGGAMVWNIDLDDFRGDCSSSTRPYPLMSLMADVLVDKSNTPSTGTTKATSTISTPTANGNFCDGKPDGVYKNVDDCGSFYECVSGNTLLIPCGPGMLFDASKMICDMETNVDCSYGGLPLDTTTTAVLLSTNGPILPPVPVSDRLRVCYYSNWSQYRSGTGAFTPDDIDPFLCTHLIYSFAKLDSSFQLAQYEYNDEQLYASFNKLKSINPNLKTLLALGGASAKSAHFSDLVSAATRRENFAVSAIDYLRRYGFDGLDMDWEYPTQHGGRSSDKANFVLLLKDLRAAFDKEGSSSGQPTLLLTAAVAAGKYFIDLAYDIPAMEKPLDFINLMAYDFHGSWESQVGHNSPLSAGSRDSDPTLNVEWAANYWHKQGVAKEKLVIGLATYGRSFTLANSANHNIGDAVTGAGNPGPYTGEAGFLAYYEICAILDKSSGDQYWEPDSRVPYVVSGNQWIGYEDVKSFTTKLNWIRDEGFGGAMVWNIDLDDFRGDCSSSTRPYPLMSLMAEVLVDKSNTSSTATSTISTPTANGNFCDGKPDGVYKNVDDCGSFYECVSGNTLLIPCGPGMLFDASKMICDMETNVDCSYGGVPSETTTTAVLLSTNIPVLPPVPVSDRLRVCYYSNWSQYRSGTGAFTPDDIDPFLCTHLIYSFAKLDSSFQLAQYEYNDEQLYASFNKLKFINPNLKTLLALGGASANSAHFSDLVSAATRRENFAVSAIDYLRRYGFDGLDMDWEYPTQHGGRSSDKANFVLLLKDLRAAFDKESSSSGQPTLLLTAAVAAGKYFIDLAYDIPAMEKPLDFINLMAYDFHGSWESQVGHNSPLSAGSRDSDTTLNVEWAANYWHKQGVAKEKLVIGLATYGRSFTLANSANHNIGDAVTGAGNPGPYTGEAGFLAYYEICAILDKSSGDQYWEPDSRVPYVVSGNQWIGYEDVKSFTEKLNWIRDEGFGGAMVWNIDLDDFRGDCSSSTRPYPLMSLMAEVLGDSSNTSVTGMPMVSSTASTPSVNMRFCDGKPDGVYKNVNDCGSSYECVSGNTLLIPCGPGMLFDASKMICDLNTNVDCSYTGTGSTTTTAGTPPHQDFCTGMPDGLYEYPHDCSMMYECAGSITYTQQCPAGTYYSPAIYNCDWISNVQCGTRPEPGATTTVTTPPGHNTFCDGKPDGVYKKTDDCGSFYECMSGHTMVIPCGPGMLFDARLQTCEMDTSVDCSYGGVLNDTTTTISPRFTNGPILPPTPVSDRLRVCYYSNWSQYRSGTGAFTPDDIDPFLCTHLIYSFAKLDSSFQLAQYEYNDEQLYASFNKLKSINPNLKTLLALGGASANSAHFSDLVSAATRRENFAVSAIDYLRRYGFDGLDMDWEYPTQHGGRASDKANFVLLLEDLRAAFDKEGSSSGQPTLLLTAAVAAGKYFIDLAYDIPAMEKPLDFINLMAYDFHGSWESQVGHNSPLSASLRDSELTLNVEWAAQYWHKQGVSKEKLVIGLSTYGRSFTLANSANHNIGDAVNGAGNPGPYTGEAGFLAYYEICAILDKSSGDQYWESDSRVPYVVSGNQWIGYEDVKSFTEKLNWIRDEGFGGAMVWNIDLDDFRGDCSSSTRPYPLMSLMAEVLVDQSNTSSTVNPSSSWTPSVTVSTLESSSSWVSVDSSYTKMSSHPSSYTMPISSALPTLSVVSSSVSMSSYYPSSAWMSSVSSKSWISTISSSYSMANSVVPSMTSSREPTDISSQLMSTDTSSYWMSSDYSAPIMSTDYSTSSIPKDSSSYWTPTDSSSDWTTTGLSSLLMSTGVSKPMMSTYSLTSSMPTDSSSYWKQTDLSSYWMSKDISPSDFSTPLVSIDNLTPSMSANSFTPWMSSGSSHRWRSSDVSTPWMSTDSLSPSMSTDMFTSLKSTYSSLYLLTTGLSTHPSHLMSTDYMSSASMSMSPISTFSQSSISSSPLNAVPVSTLAPSSISSACTSTAGLSMPLVSTSTSVSSAIPASSSLLAATPTPTTLPIPHSDVTSISYTTVTHASVKESSAIPTLSPSSATTTLPTVSTVLAATSTPTTPTLSHSDVTSISHTTAAHTSVKASSAIPTVSPSSATTTVPTVSTGSSLSLSSIRPGAATSSLLPSSAVSSVISAAASTGMSMPTISAVSLSSVSTISPTISSSTSQLRGTTSLDMLSTTTLSAAIPSPTISTASTASTSTIFPTTASSNAIHSLASSITFDSTTMQPHTFLSTPPSASMASIPMSATMSTNVLSSGVTSQFVTMSSRNALSPTSVTAAISSSSLTSSALPMPTISAVSLSGISSITSIITSSTMSPTMTPASMFSSVLTTAITNTGPLSTSASTLSSFSISSVLKSTADVSMPLSTVLPSSSSSATLTTVATIIDSSAAKVSSMSSKATSVSVIATDPTLTMSQPTATVIMPSSVHSPLLTSSMSSVQMPMHTTLTSWHSSVSAVSTNTNPSTAMPPMSDSSVKYTSASSGMTLSTVPTHFSSSISSMLTSALPSTTKLSPVLSSATSHVSTSLPSMSAGPHSSVLIVSSTISSPAAVLPTDVFASSSMVSLLASSSTISIVLPSTMASTYISTDASTSVWSAIPASSSLIAATSTHTTPTLSQSGVTSISHTTAAHTSVKTSSSIPTLSPSSATTTLPTVSTVLAATSTPVLSHSDVTSISHTTAAYTSVKASSSIPTLSPSSATTTLPTVSIGSSLTVYSIHPGAASSSLLSSSTVSSAISAAASTGMYMPTISTVPLSSVSTIAPTTGSSTSQLQSTTSLEISSPATLLSAVPSPTIPTQSVASTSTIFSTTAVSNAIPSLTSTSTFVSTTMHPNTFLSTVSASMRTTVLPSDVPSRSVTSLHAVSPTSVTAAISSSFVPLSTIPMPTTSAVSLSGISSIASIITSSATPPTTTSASMFSSTTSVSSVLTTATANTSPLSSSASTHLLASVLSISQLMTSSTPMVLTTAQTSTIVSSTISTSTYATTSTAITTSAASTMSAPVATMTSLSSASISTTAASTTLTPMTASSTTVSTMMSSPISSIAPTASTSSTVSATASAIARPVTTTSSPPTTAGSVNCQAGSGVCLMEAPGLGSTAASVRPSVLPLMLSVLLPLLWMLKS